ncbi:hypothetical protein LLG95_05945 [bacterium]|nr:hypothetical protein [bacterium]
MIMVKKTTAPFKHAMNESLEMIMRRIIGFLIAAFVIHPVFAADWKQVLANDHWTSRAGHAADVFQDKIYVLGGRPPTADVWYSGDASNWSRATANAGWPARWGHAALAFDNKLWVLGGETNSSYFNDVWNSENGVDWSIVTNHAAWAPRSEFGAVVFNGAMWVAGGKSTNAAFSDVWRSTNGTSWTLETQNPGWSDQYGSGCYGLVALVHQGNLWLLGGIPGFPNLYSVDGQEWHKTQPWDFRAGFGAVSLHNQLIAFGGWAPYSETDNPDMIASSDGNDWLLMGYNYGWKWRSYFATVLFHSRIYMLGGSQDPGAGILNDIWVYDDVNAVKRSWLLYR